MESLHAFLTEQAAACKRSAAALTADDRCDEAVFEKIRANVYEIFASVLAAAQKTADPAAFFRARLADIPASWEAALEKARSHGDEARAHTETVKLDVVRAIRERLEAAV